jgi:hypothetical protein
MNPEKRGNLISPDALEMSAEASMEKAEAFFEHIQSGYASGKYDKFLKEKTPEEIKVSVLKYISMHHAELLEDERSATANQYAKMFERIRNGDLEALRIFLKDMAIRRTIEEGDRINTWSLRRAAGQNLDTDFELEISYAQGLKDIEVVDQVLKGTSKVA